MNIENNNSLIIKHNKSRFQKFFSSTIILITIILTFLIGLFAIFKTVYFETVINFAGEECKFKFDNVFLNIIYTILVISFLFFAYKKIIPKLNKKILLTLMIIFSLTLGFWWVNYVKLKPISDQSMVIYCAEKILDNDLKAILSPGEYLNRNPHQLGFVIYLINVFKIFNTRNPIYAQNLNVIYSAVCSIILYLIVKELFNEDIVHKISLLFLAFFSIYFAFFSTHVYGNIPGLMFGLISILFTLKYLDSKKTWYLIIIAITITISYLLKSNYEIFLLAIIIELTLNIFNTKRIKSIIGIIGIIIMVFATKSIVYTIFEKTTNYSIKDTGVPMTSYIYMGFAEPVTLSPGWYTGDVENIYIQSGYNKKKSGEITKALMEKRLDYLSKNPDYTIDFIYKKLETTWLNPTFQVFWCSTPSIVLDLAPDYNAYIASQKLLISILCGRAFSIEERIMDVYQIITFLFASFALISIFKEGSLKNTLLPLTFSGGFLFHFLWETKSIYVLQYYYLLIPYAAYGIYKLFSIIDKKINVIKK